MPAMPAIVDIHAMITNATVSIIVFFFFILACKVTNKRVKCKINPNLFSFPSESDFEMKSQSYEIISKHQTKAGLFPARFMSYLFLL